MYLGNQIHSDATGERPIYSTPSYTLTSDRVVEGNHVAQAMIDKFHYLVNAHQEKVRPQLKNDYPIVSSQVSIIDVMYRVAINDLEMNIIDGTYFRVSPDFPNMIFTRDAAYSSFLGANFALPNIIKNHLEMDRGLRRRIGFKCPAKHELPISGIENEVEEDLDNYTFFLKYGSHSYGRRTDDVCWVIGYWDYYCIKGDTVALQFLIDEFEYFDEHFYQKFYDDRDGLYWGQASFIDVGGTGYPQGYTIQDSIMIKALSTNCLYVGALDRLAKAYKLQGDMEKEERIEERSNNLKEAIRKGFLHKDGYYAYFKDRKGNLEPRREQLGMAFLILFDILEQKDYSLAIDNYPGNDFGSPEFWPFYPGDKVYHNNALWPFADTLFDLARFKANRSKDVLLRTLGNLSRHAILGNFPEVLDYETGGWKFKHTRSYIWSAAAYLAVLFKMIAGIDVSDKGKVSFKPFLPEELGDFFLIEKLAIDRMKLRIEIRGNGRDVEKCVIDGEEKSEPVFVGDSAEHTIILEVH